MATEQAEDKQVVLVTGGGRGIGSAIARALATPKRLIYIHYGTSEVAAKTLADELNSSGRPARTIAADLFDPASCQQLISDIVAQEGKLDILVNNAGITRDQLAVRMGDTDYDDVIQVNQKAPFIIMREAAKSMMRQRWGRIINISSIVGLMGNAGQINYAASKAAVIAMTKSLALELAARNVTVNCIAPGFIETDMTSELSEEIRQIYRQTIPLRRFGRPEDIAALASFLVSDEAGYITAQTISVDGGINR
ncbi:MAG TPA: 3-oxoacyl-[acyl-carrier-protein] reductase [Clostridiaceae bacterium]|nr:3-oxoacyl-[acyl-carrier-protein] reductase [Clostridiaceae bacterium]